MAANRGELQRDPITSSPTPPEVVILLLVTGIRFKANAVRAVPPVPATTICIGAGKCRDDTGDVSPKADNTNHGELQFGRQGL